jgi:hypothetical protein
MYNWAETRTQNTVWYLLLPTFGDKKPKRKTVIDAIRAIYKKYRVKRSEGGIIAGVRAELYFKGEWKSVSFGAIQELAERGTDLVFIEKQGIAEVLTNYADKWGISLVNTRGYYTEYAKDLMDAAEKSGAHVVVMTDYDISGISIASQADKRVPWIGIDENTLEYFGDLDRNDPTLSVPPTNQKILNTVEDTVKFDSRFSNVDMQFLKKRRIEIDAVLAKVGNERFFEYILDKLKGLYPNRNYNRAVELPKIGDFNKVYETNLIGVKHEDSIATIEARKMEILNPELEKIKGELADVQGFIDVNEKEEESKERLKNIINANPHYKDFADKLDNLVKTHQFFTKED